MTAKTVQGKCLCQAVQVSLQYEESCFDVCHCGICRRWGGGPALTMEVTSSKIDGLEAVQIFKSSDWAERGFCKNCGTHLFFRLLDGDFYNFSWGLFADLKDFSFRRQIYIEDKPDCYDFKNRTEMWTEQDLLKNLNKTSENPE